MFVFPHLISCFYDSSDHFVKIHCCFRMPEGILDASRLAEQVILVKLSTDQQMIKYAQHLSGKSDYANFSAC